MRNGLIRKAPLRSSVRVKESAITEDYGMGIDLRRRRLEQIICHITLGDYLEA